MSGWINPVRRLKWWVIGCALLLCVCFLGWYEQNIRIWASFELKRATPLPDFDLSKAASLSSARRASLEQELFGEIYMWDTQSRRYHGPGGGLELEMRWRAMANEGLELAQLALMVFEPSTAHMHNPLPALKRLDELARQGEAGAMCLIPVIASRLPERGGIDWSQQIAAARFWMTKGADVSHPVCLAMLGARIQSGTDGFVRDVPRGRAMLFKALNLGYRNAASSFWLYFMQRGLGEFPNRRLAYCWGYQAAKYRNSDADLTLQVYLDKAGPERRQLLESELREFRAWFPTTEECINLTNHYQGE